MNETVKAMLEEMARIQEDKRAIAHLDFELDE